MGPQYQGSDDQGSHSFRRLQRKHVSQGLVVSPVDRAIDPLLRTEVGASLRLGYSKGRGHPYTRPARRTELAVSYIFEATSGAPPRGA